MSIPPRKEKSEVFLTILYNSKKSLNTITLYLEMRIKSKE